MSPQAQEHLLYGLAIVVVAGLVVRVGSCIEAEETSKREHTLSMRKAELEALRSAPCPPAGAASAVAPAPAPQSIEGGPR